jgi:hypothetical protein
MVRIQIRLEQKQLDSLRERAVETGKSIAELVREGVTPYLGPPMRLSRDDQITRALAASGQFASGRKDTSKRHDRYFAEALVRQAYLC